jgi:hypothetical protein
VTLPVYSSSEVNSSEALCSSEYAPLASSSDLPLETELEALSLAAYVTSRRQQHLEVILINKAGALHETSCFQSSHTLCPALLSAGGTSLTTSD